MLFRIPSLFSNRSRLFFLVLGFSVILTIILPRSPSHPIIRKLIPSRVAQSKPLDSSIYHDVDWQGEHDVPFWKEHSVNRWIGGWDSNGKPTLLITGGAGQLGDLTLIARDV